MSMMIGKNKGNRKVLTIKSLDGTTVGTISITNSSKKKKKRLQYNFKAISTQIMMSKTSNGANQAATKARGKVTMLQRKQRTGDYDDTELERAILHAKRMERIAKKRKRNLEEEEKIERKGSDINEAKAEDVSDLRCITDEQKPESGKKASEVLTEEFRELMENSLEEIEDELTELNELTDEITGIVREDADPEDLERLKKKHRAEELREIAKADMEYLRALFDKLQKEKQQNISGVSLQLEGMEMPVEIMEMPVMAEGGNIDLTV